MIGKCYLPESERIPMFSENGLTAPVSSVNACRPAYPGYNNATINALAFLIHDIEDARPVISNDDDTLMIGAPGSNSGIMGDNWMSKGTDQVSVHFGVSPDYTVFCLSLTLGAWGAGPNANGFCIQAEQSGVAAYEYATWTSEPGMRQLHRMATLYAELCHLYGWTPHWTTDQEIQACASGSGAFGVGGALYHSDITRNFPGDTTHSDPGDNYPGKPSGPYVIGDTHPNDLFMPLALSIFNGVNTPVTTPPATHHTFMEALMSQPGWPTNYAEFLQDIADKIAVVSDVAQRSGIGFDGEANAVAHGEHWDHTADNDGAQA